MKKEATPSRTSPKNSKRGCLCKNGRTYSSKCCDGSIQAQGIGSLTGNSQQEDGLSENLTPVKNIVTLL